MPVPRYLYRYCSLQELTLQFKDREEKDRVCALVDQAEKRQLTIDEAGLLKSAVSRDRRAWVREIILNSRIYFPSRTQFNDPYDSTASIVFESSEQERRASLAPIAKKRFSPFDPRRVAQEQLDTGIFEDPAATVKMAVRWQSKIDALGILSLSARPRHILLWSHYADAHKGVCLRFRTDLPEDPFCDARKVDYTKTFPTVNMVRGDGEQIIRGLLLTKAIPWRYEAEWRVVDTKGYGYKSFRPESLCGVIFGWKMSARDRRTVIEWNAERGTPLPTYAAHPDERNRFQVKIRRLPRSDQ